MEKKEDIEKNGADQVSYFAIHITHIIVGAIFFGLGVYMAIYWDYGLLVFLFAIPQFLATGLIPTLISLLLLYRAFVEAENVTISSSGEKLSVKTSWIRKKSVQYDFNDIKYVSLRYRETRAKRWLIAFMLLLFTIYGFYQNAVDLFGYARLAPALVIGTIIMTVGTLIFIAFPRRFLVIGTNEETVLIPYRNQPREITLKMLEILKVDLKTIEEQKSSDILLDNIKSNILDFILGIFLITFGILLLTMPIYYGYFVELICLSFGLKLLSRIFNGEPYYDISSQDNLYLGRSPFRLTFIKAYKPDIERIKSVSPLRFHPLEILCVFFLTSQAFKYGFRNIWWPYAGINVFYLIIGIAMIALLLIRWVNPYSIICIKFEKFSIDLREQTSFKRDFVSNLKSSVSTRDFLISLVVFASFIIVPAIYFVIGGDFHII